MQQAQILPWMVFDANCILGMVMIMKDSKEMLSSMLKTTQMGQIGIRSVLDTTMRPSLRKALESQLQEYDMIETEAHAIAAERGWELPELDPALRFMADMMTKTKLASSTSRILRFPPYPKSYWTAKPPISVRCKTFYSAKRSSTGLRFALFFYPRHNIF